MKEFLAKIFPWYYPYSFRIDHLINCPIVDTAPVLEEIHTWAHETGTTRYQIRKDHRYLLIVRLIDVRFKCPNDLLAAKLRFG